MNNYRTVFFTIGMLLIILGAFMFIPFFVQFIYNEKNNTFISSAFITSFIGVLLVLTNLQEDRKLNLQEAFLLTTLTWLSIAIFGSLPFFLSDLNLSFVDSFFESMSGITTTGSTIITNLDNAPKGILIWRALLQWLGGIGVIVMAITILPLLNVGGMQLFRIKGSDTAEKILPKTREVTLVISTIYLTLTFICGFCYWLFGMNAFDGIAHAMTTIATGGFSTYSSSIGYFQNAKIEIISIIFIILGSIPFIAYLKFVKGRKYLAPGLFGPCGYGFPSILGAKIGCPDTPVVGFAGDGAFGISMSEMTSCNRKEWPNITMVIFRNYQWGAEKRNSILWYDNNFIGTELDPELSYAKIAEACGFRGVKVTSQTELTETIKDACNAQNKGITTFIEVILNQELGEPFRRDAMKKPVQVAGISSSDLQN